MTTYLINSPVLTAYGDWHFEGPLDPNSARAILDTGFISAVGHDASARFLSTLLGLEVPVKRITIAMAPGDRALVLRLKERLPENRLLSSDEMRDFPFELGLLHRIC